MVVLDAVYGGQMDIWDYLNLPSISFKINNLSVDFEKGIDMKLLEHEIDIVAIGNRNIYEIGEIEIYLKRKQESVSTINSKSGNASLSSLATLAKEGDFLVVQIKNMYLLGINGKRTLASTRGMIYTIPLN